MSADVTVTLVPPSGEDPSEASFVVVTGPVPRGMLTLCVSGNKIEVRGPNKWSYVSVAIASPETLIAFEQGCKLEEKPRIIICRDPSKNPFVDPDEVRVIRVIFEPQITQDVNKR